MITIKTARLLLLPHSPEAIRIWKTDRLAMEQYMGLAPYGLQLEDWALRELDDAFDYWITNMEQYPEAAGWYTGWEIVLADARIAIGGIGAAGPPNEAGELLIGYHVDQRHRGTGIAAEAVQGLVSWAFGQEAVKSVAATIPSWNTPSLRTVQRCGFRQDGFREDNGMTVEVWRLEKP